MLTIGVSIDPIKAFNTINHDILVKKTEHYGNRGVVSELIKRYIGNIEQFVRVNNVFSDYKEVTCDIPQG